MYNLCGGVGNQEVELLVPEGGFVTAPPAGGVILAAAHHLGPQAQPTVGIALPGETPHPQAARLYQIHLCQQCRGSAFFPCLDCLQRRSKTLSTPQTNPCPLSYCKSVAEVWRKKGQGVEHTCCFFASF